MTCSSCTTAKTFPQHRMFCPSCLPCGVRIIQRLGELPISQAECTQRRRAMLAVWVEWGHDEQQIRALVKGPLCTGLAEATASAPPTNSKPRSRGQKSSTASTRT